MVKRRGDPRDIQAAPRHWESFGNSLYEYAARGNFRREGRGEHRRGGLDGHDGSVNPARPRSAERAGSGADVSNGHRPGWQEWLDSLPPAIESAWQSTPPSPVPGCDLLILDEGVGASGHAQPIYGVPSRRAEVLTRWPRWITRLRARSRYPCHFGARGCRRCGPRGGRARLGRRHHPRSDHSLGSWDTVARTPTDVKATPLAATPTRHSTRLGRNRVLVAKISGELLLRAGIMGNP